MLKRSLAIGLSVVMAAEVLTGCSGGSGTAETKAADTEKNRGSSQRSSNRGRFSRRKDSYCVPLYGTVRETGRPGKAGRRI